LVSAAILSLLLLADGGDEAFLLRRLTELAARYDDQARKQTPAAVALRGSVVRELAHLPFRDASRSRAGRLLARIVAQDRAYRVRAEAARAIGRIGTARALTAVYSSLFGEDGRSRRYALLYYVLPEALAALKHPEDLDWISQRVLRPAASGRALPVEAGPLRGELVALTLEGVGRARARSLVPDVRALAASSSETMRLAALRALADLDAGDELLDAAARSEDPRARVAAAASTRLPAPRARALLVDERPEVRRAAIRGLTKRRPREATPFLVEALADESLPEIRLDLAEMLHRLTGREFGADPDRWRDWWAANAERFDGPRSVEERGRAYFFQVRLRTERAVFLIDVSASMGRTDERGVTRRDRAARELARTVATLSPGARFRVLAFAADIRRFPEGDLDWAGRDRARDAATWLAGLEPAGATNTYGALMQAFDDPLRPDTIVLLSDGNPYRCSYRGKTYSEHEQILHEVRRVNAERFVRIHTVALLSGARPDDASEDSAAAASFLHRLAEANDGEFREVR
jgi:hypothetical protein